jgi:non-specific serine/threonine protein kinase
MRGAIAWSYDLLTEEEQTLFRRLAVFSGGCTVEAANAIANLEDDPHCDAFDGIASLVTKNLLRRVSGRSGHSRYEMPEIVREFALECLAESGETEVYRRHAAWCVETAEWLWVVMWLGPAKPHLLDALSDEHDNMRSALAWLEQEGDAVDGLRLAAALCPFWYFRSHRREGWRWLEDGLEATGEVPARVRARALHGAAILWEGWPASARYLEASLPLWRDLGDRWGIGASLLMLGLLANNEGDYARAAHLCDQALEAFASTNITWQAAAELERGRAEFGEGELARATDWFRASLAHAREGDDPHGAGLALNSLALVGLMSGDAPGVAAVLAESLGIWRRVARQEGLAQCLAEVAMLAAATEQAAAARLWGAVAGLRQIVGFEFGLPERDCFAASETALRADLGEAAFAREFVAGQTLGVQEAFAEAEAVIAGATAPEPPAARLPAAFSLTPRELEVLRLVVAGQTDREIAETLFISRRTAEGHVAGILAKLDVRSRAAAVALALQAGIVAPEGQTAS